MTLDSGNVESAIVTGAASGIGRATALCLARRGARIGLVDRNESGIKSVEQEIRNIGGVAQSFAVDITSSASLANAIAAFVAEIGYLNSVVSAAGIAKEGLVHKMDETDWDRVISVNLKGTFLLAKHTIPFLLKSPRSAFVAISSDAGVQGAVGYGAYCASKHAVVGLVRCMALEYGPKGLRSNAICPAFVDTPMADQIFARAPAGTREYFEKIVPLGRFARPEEVADAAAHLSSKEASYCNGMVYMIDGGVTAGFFNTVED